MELTKVFVLISLFLNHKDIENNKKAPLHEPLLIVPYHLNSNLSKLEYIHEW